MATKTNTRNYARQTNKVQHLNLFVAGNVHDRMYPKLDKYTEGYDHVHVFNVEESPIVGLCKSYAYKKGYTHTAIDASAFDDASGWMQFTAEPGKNKVVLLCGGDFLPEMKIAKTLGGKSNVEYQYVLPEQKTANVGEQTPAKSATASTGIRTNNYKKAEPQPAPQPATTPAPAPAPAVQPAVATPTGSEQYTKLNVAKDIIDGVYMDICRDSSTSREDMQELHNILMQLQAFTARMK